MTTFNKLGNWKTWIAEEIQSFIPLMVKYSKLRKYEDNFIQKSQRPARIGIERKHKSYGNHSYDSGKSRKNVLIVKIQNKNKNNLIVRIGNQRVQQIFLMSHKFKVLHDI